MSTQAQERRRARAREVPAGRREGRAPLRHVARCLGVIARGRACRRERRAARAAPRQNGGVGRRTVQPLVHDVPSGRAPHRARGRPERRDPLRGLRVRRERLGEGRVRAERLRRRLRGPDLPGARAGLQRVSLLCGNQECAGCTRYFFTKSSLGNDAAVLARSSGEEPASPRHRAGTASMAWRTTR